MRVCNKCRENKPSSEFHRGSYKCKPCACEVSRLWHKNNLKRANKNSKKWSLKNKKKSAEYKRRWQRANKDWVNAKARARYKTKRYKELRKKYEGKNRAKINARALARYYSDTPNRRRKRLARAAVREAILRGELVKRICKKCGSNRRIHAHHHMGYARKNRLNVIWLCVRCHSKEHHET